MNKLGALDAAFLYNETADCPQSIASVQILELPDGVSEAAFVADLKSLLRERLHLVPHFTSKPQFVPFDLDHPIWVKDCDFHIDNHVHTLRVPAPGDRQALEATIARLHQSVLDRSKPLWDLWVLTGLEDGRVAYYNRVHHACLDGMSGQAMIETIMDLTAEPRQVPAAPEGFLRRSNRQNLAQLLIGALENFARYQSKQPLAALNTLETGARLFRRAYDPGKGLGAVKERAPRTRFNRTVRNERAYAMGEIPLATVKTIAHVTRTTVNDVFLAVCAGGLRHYFQRTGELPAKSLIAGCPVSLRAAGDTSASNQVSMMMVSLATDEADAGRRLQEIAHSARTAKGFTRDVAAGMDTDVALPGLPALMGWGSRLAGQMGLADLPGLPLLCNLVISNVPGPQVPLFSCGARVLTHYPVSIPAHAQGVNITVQSYNGTLYFGITACARALPDADVLRDDLLSAFQELKQLYDLPTLSAAAQQSSTSVEATQVPESAVDTTPDHPKAA